MNYNYEKVKRIFDLVIAGAGLLLLAPFFLLTALLIRLETPGPAFFRQERAGKNGRPFRIFKFRSMAHVPKPVHGYQEQDDPCITRVGHWLRRFSIDELPQLINVLIGEMSLIGPRPALPHQVERYDSRQRRRLQVRPGMTGWAQVNGRNNISWEEKIGFDLWYVEHHSLQIDLYILIKTIWVVLSQSGIYFRGRGSAWRSSSADEGNRI